MRARRGHQAGVGRRGGTSVRRSAAAIAVVAAGALSLTAGVVPASAAAGYTVTATIPVGANPGGAAFDPANGKVYVANYGPGTVSVIDPVTGTVTATIPIGTHAGEVAVDPATGTVYVDSPGGLSLIDPATDTVTTTIPLGGAGWMAFDPATGTVYVLAGGGMDAIDTATKAVTSNIYPGFQPGAMAVDPAAGTVYVGNYGAGTVSVMDAATGTVTATIQVGLNPGAMAFDPATDAVYVANTDYVSVIDAATNTVTATVPVGSYPIAVAFDPATGTVYTADFWGNSVSVIDAATNTVTATVPVGPDPLGTSGLEPDAVAVDPITHAAYVANDVPGTVSVISPGAAQAQAITFTSAPPAKPVTGGTYQVSATGGGSGNPVTFTIGAASTSVCSISGKVVTFNAAGSCVIDANQAGNAGYLAAPQAKQTVTVGRAAAKLSWAAPAPVTYGTALTGAQLDATASVPGTFRYSPPAGRVLKAGTQTLTAAFTPANPAAYTGGTVSAKITVRPAALRVTASGRAMTYGSAPPTITASYAGFVHGDSAASLTTRPACSTTATSASPPGRYLSSCSGAADPDYAISYTPGTVTVDQAATALAYGGPQSVPAGTKLAPAAVLTSPAGACEDAQPVTFTLNDNPTDGFHGTYRLESATTSADGAATGAPVSTSGWRAGAYAITVSYAGTGDCGPSTTTAPLAVTVPA